MVIMVAMKSWAVLKMAVSTQKGRTGPLSSELLIPCPRPLPSQTRWYAVGGYGGGGIGTQAESVLSLVTRQRSSSQNLVIGRQDTWQILYSGLILGKTWKSVCVIWSILYSETTKSKHYASTYGLGGGGESTWVHFSRAEVCQQSHCHDGPSCAFLKNQTKTS